jgi:predicted nuclease of predicted toxin-antitoxin system
MARFYSNENFERQAVEELRALGHDVLTSAEAGYANSAVSDEEVLAFAASANRIVLTHNRLHFVRLHSARGADHSGIVVCSVDLDFRRLARRIDEAVSARSSTANQLLRINLKT